MSVSSEALFLLLAETFQKARRCLNIIMKWAHFLSMREEFLRSRWSVCACFTVCEFILLAVSRVLRALFACLIYIWKISTEFRAMFSINYACFADSSVMTINCSIHCVLHYEKKSWSCAECEILYDHHFEMHNSCSAFSLFAMRLI